MNSKKGLIATKKILALAVAMSLLLLTPAYAANTYIIPDSDHRLLTEAELWDWDYESLGFILNEIFARHGYCFETGSKFYNYFMQQDWYQPNANPNNQEACYPQLSAIEWKNEHLIKQVRELREAYPQEDAHKRNYRDTLTGFYQLPILRPGELESRQSVAVYSAPDYNAFRSANGKAAVGNGPLLITGREDGWMMICYQRNNAAYRIGYVDCTDIYADVPAGRLSFMYADAYLTESTSLTDDPELSFSLMAKLEANRSVTMLAQYHNTEGNWAYIETDINGQTARGFVPLDAVCVLE